MTNSFLDFKVINVADTAQLEKEFQGKVDKGVFICFLTEDVELIPFLTKVLGAVKLDLENDVLVLQKTPDNNFSFSSVAKAKGITKALFFGVSPKDVGFQAALKKYTLTTLGDFTILFADSLAEISNQQALKKQLWVALQQLFAS
ncbi:MAG: hypothetical protein AAF960_03515 [Bacteroidota bacterium]